MKKRLHASLVAWDSDATLIIGVLFETDTEIDYSSVFSLFA